MNEEILKRITGDMDRPVFGSGCVVLNCKIDEDKKEEKNQSLKPIKIYTNEAKRIVVVKWSDGTTTKATCSPDDHFDVTVGFAMCYVKKVYGGKQKVLRNVKKLSK